MVKLYQLSNKAQEFFQKDFDLEAGIDEPNDKGDTPLIFAITRNEFGVSGTEIEIIEELLDCDANINQSVSGVPPLCYAIEWGNYEAFEVLLNHSNSSIQKIDLNAILKRKEELFTWEDFINQENTLLFLIRKAFRGCEDLSDPRYIENFEIHKKMLRRILLEESIDFNFYNDDRNAIWVLLSLFEGINQWAHYRIPFFIEVLQYLLQKNINLNINFIPNSKLPSLKDKIFDEDFNLIVTTSPINRLFDFNEHDDGVSQPYQIESENNLMHVLKILFKQSQDIRLNVYDTNNHRKGSPIKLALSIPIPRVATLLCEEIRCQALKMILNEKLKKESGMLNPEDQYILREKIKIFVEDHHYHDNENRENVAARAFEMNAADNEMNAENEISAAENETRIIKSVLHEEILNFVEKMIAPQKCLADIVHSKVLKKSLEESGFNLKGDFYQVSKEGLSLLNFAAKNTLKELILGLGLQPDFNKHYKNPEIKKAIVFTMEQDNPAICLILLNLAEPTKELFSKLIEIAIDKKKVSFVKLFVDYYNQIGGAQKLKFNLLDPKESYNKSLVTRSIRLGNCPYLIQELLSMTIENAPKYNSSPTLLDTKLDMEERSKEYTAQFLERHDSSSMKVIQSQIINPYMEYYKYMRKVVIDYGFFNVHIATCKLEGVTKEFLFKNVHVAQILGFLGSPYDSVFKARNHNLLEAAVRSVQMCYNKVYAKRAALAKETERLEQAELTAQEGDEASEGRSAKRRKKDNNPNSGLTWTFDSESMEVSESYKKSKSLKNQRQSRI